jgi:ATPase subunit of ABC transporter with duplicated ATPase domains
MMRLSYIAAGGEFAYIAGKFVPAGARPHGTPVHLSHVGPFKSYGAKKMLENVHLSFYPDAKIGILGPNGAGKSTMLRIIAGQDKEYTGEAWLAEGATVGYLEQEPHLDPNKTAFENVMEGVADKTAIIDRYNELMMNYSDETADEGAKLQDIIDSQNLWDLEQQVEMAMEALACPPKDADVTKLSGGERRRIALCRCCCRSRICCCSTNRPTISTPRPSPGLKSICATIRAP